MPSRAESARALVCRAIYDVVVARRSLDRALAASAGHDERSLIAELAYGTVRHYFSLHAEVSARIRTPMKPRDAIVECVLLVGAYQLRHTRIPTYAAVSESVHTVEALERPWAKGLVNAVLRRIAREPPTAGDDEARFDQPRWIIEALHRDWPTEALRILEVLSERAPMSLRIDRRMQTREQYLATLTAAGIHARLGLGEEALRLEAPVPASELPDFARGAVSVQDEGAQLAADLLPLGGAVLDACAAPGGKAFHMLERAPTTRLVALDIDPTRCADMRVACARGGFDPGCVVTGDATKRDWWSGEPFDAVLVDAPCSGTGTLRRHPDIRLLKSARDLPAFAALQLALLENLWTMLRPGGALVYCTCSVLTEENDNVVGRFLERTADSSLAPLDVAWGVATRCGRQLLPESGGPDGFYFAKLIKRGA